MNRQPVLIMLIFFILGIIIRDVFPETIKGLLYLEILIMSLLFLSIFFQNRLLVKLRVFLLGLFFFLVGIEIHQFNKASKQLNIGEENHNFVFVLRKKLKSTPKYQRYEVDVLSMEKHKFIKPFPILLSFPKDEPGLDYQHYYQARGYINSVLPPKNDFQFDYAKYLSRKGIFHQSFVNEGITNAPRVKLGFLEKIKQKRLNVLKNIDASNLPLQVISFLKGIILADRTEMDEAVTEDFNKSGLVHFLAISGTHFAIIFGALLLFFKPLFSAQQRRIPILISLILIWLFAVFIDFGSSVVRSCIMITVYYIFILLERKPDLLHSLSLAGFIILLMDSQQLFDIGFQLSFVAVLGIYAFNSSLLKYFPPPKNKFQNILFQVFTVSISAQLSTAPLILFYFHQYSFISILANLVILPFSEIIILFSFLMTILYGIGFQLDILSMLYQKVVEVLLELIHFFASQKPFFFEQIPFGLLEVMVAFVILYYLKLWMQKTILFNFSRLIFVLLLFVGLRSVLNIHHQKKDEVLRVQNFKQTVLIQKTKHRAVFWISSDENFSKLTTYLIHPYLNSRRIKSYEIKTIPKGANEALINGEVLSLQRGYLE